MYNIGNYVVYKRDVCKIKDLKKINDQEYLVLEPIVDSSLIISTQADNRNDYLRELITRERLEEIINEIPSIPVIDCHEKMIESQYRELLNSGDLLDLVKIIKTAYFRNKERLDNNKKVGDRDSDYFNKAENCLYNEFSIVLDLNYEDTKKYILDKIIKIEKQD